MSVRKAAAASGFWRILATDGYPYIGRYPAGIRMPAGERDISNDRSFALEFVSIEYELTALLTIPSMVTLTCQMIKSWDPENLNTIVVLMLIFEYRKKNL